MFQETSRRLSAAHCVCLNLLHNKMAKTNDSVNKQWAVQLGVACGAARLCLGKGEDDQ